MGFDSMLQNVFQSLAPGQSGISFGVGTSMCDPGRGLPGTNE
jgi:hypothetical protein